MISHLFFDVGGVLGTSGWGSDARARAVARFRLEEADFDRRHREVVGQWEEGRMTLDEYLDCTVFHVPRPFEREAFVAFMREQSRPHPDSIALARALADTGRYRLMTLNNES
jgi:putative hydrolase of the HAD superfamily